MKASGWLLLTADGNKANNSTIRTIACHVAAWKNRISISESRR